MNEVMSIQSLNRQHLGFVLFEFGTGVDARGCWEGTCVFDIFPMEAELGGAPLADLLYRYHFRESGEHRVELTRTDQSDVYEIIPRLVPRLRIEITSAGEGTIIQAPDCATAIAYVRPSRNALQTGRRVATCA